MSTSGGDAARELYDYMHREYENARVDAVRGLAQRQGDAEPYRGPGDYLSHNAPGNAKSENVPHWGQKTLRRRHDGRAVSAATAAAVFGYMEVYNKYLTAWKAVDDNNIIALNANLPSDTAPSAFVKSTMEAIEICQAPQHQHGVSHPDKHGSTVPTLLRYASSGHMQCVKALLRHGAMLD